MTRHAMTIDPEELKSRIRSVPDFPKPGILFYDITTLLQDPTGFRMAIDSLVVPFQQQGIEVVVGIVVHGLSDPFGRGPVSRPCGRGRVVSRDVADTTRWRVPTGLVDLAALEPVTDDAQGQEVLALFAEDDPEAVDVGVVELAVSRWCALGVDEPLALEETDLRDGDVGKFLQQQRQHLADRQVRTIGHCVSHRHSGDTEGGTFLPAARHLAGAAPRRCADR